MDNDLWLAAPCAAIKIWNDESGLRWQANPAALEWGRLAELRDADWRAVAEQLAAEQGSDRGAGMLAVPSLRWNSVRVADGWVVWLQTGEVLSAKFEKALNLAKVSVWHVDAHLGRIVFNDIGREVTGLVNTPEGIDLEQVRATVHPDDIDAIVRAADEAMQRPGVVDVEARYRNADGSYRHLLTRRVAERDAQGKAIGLMGISLDQTTRIVERERARALARRIELVTEAARVGVWSVDTVHDSVEWNAEMLRIYGLAPDTAAPSLKRWIGEMVHPDDRRALVTERRQAAEAGRLDFEADFRVVRPDGEVRWVTCRSRRELREGGELVVGIHLDVTEQTLQRQRAEEAQRDRESAQRANIAKSEFLARISHELRTPLNAVLGFAQLLEHDQAANRLPPLQLERVTHIRSAGEHLMALIGDVLDLSAIEAGNLVVAREPVSVDAALGDVASWLAPLAAAGRVDVRVERSDAWVLADAQRLRQILVNLATDAVKYAQAGGTVWLAAHSGEQAGAAGWFICVRDDGRGLTATEREHLADSFARLESERQTKEPKEYKEPTIGLTIVRRLAEFMGGRVDVVSADGSSSEFRVWLPASAASPAATTVGQGGEEGSQAPRLSILYIEDNPVNVLLVKELVAMRPGVALVCCVDGVSGVERALQDRPDVVLVDMQLPDIDGYEVLERLRGQPGFVGSSIIALSANGMSDDIERAKAAGFDDYWTKPIDFRRFLAGLDALVAAKDSALQ